MANINIAIRQAEQDAICMSCALPDCVGRESRECPIQAEQRRRWRANNQRRKVAGYFETRELKRKTTQVVGEDRRI
jgi:hypothetical protein